MQFVLRLAEDRRQARGDADRVTDVARLNEERFGRGRRRERPALAVDDRPALRVQDHRAGVLALGELGELAVLDDHQPAETSGEAAEREGEDRRQQQDARPDGRILHGAGGLEVRKDAARFWSAARPVPPATYSFASRIWSRPAATRPICRARASMRLGERKVATSISSWRMRASARPRSVFTASSR